ncbi:Schizosaccharomyces pombe specific protein [Schizosaccharomyces pombe]|uniref:Uncharacterized protein C23H4.05c n=1 Tax=Schizosaccharomyces pombe (strain 972 / ATCC 24843) TaxID=284812 RepID=YEH5_SCHPO|nr:uncharacterized protein SPAC23H4.05c [Schizosaccharomyces pombe]O13948.1 RecName: Full=Uncharacterized protein C23H4.05c; Flags: Precursor [Schizosaccharomyces pombe 972h-]CAB11674.1 sequence orphan [Schizosaccharomyces pombe]|eukprot:NP_593401.1 uncharacterized protein SPAC23H4.05c [Schizosaccharomyces pombe]
MLLHGLGRMNIIFICFPSLACLLTSRTPLCAPLFSHLDGMTPCPIDCGFAVGRSRGGGFGGKPESNSLHYDTMHKQHAMPFFIINPTEWKRNFCNTG